jgi:hypothetical protein
MKKFKINWNYIVYLVRKLISKFGYVCFGAFGAVGIEYGFDKILMVGMGLALLVGVLATYDNKKPVKSEKDF